MLWLCAIFLFPWWGEIQVKKKIEMLLLSLSLISDSKLIWSSIWRKTGIRGGRFDPELHLKLQLRFNHKLVTSHVSFFSCAVCTVQTGGSIGLYLFFLYLYLQFSVFSCWVCRPGSKWRKMAGVWLAELFPPPSRNLQSSVFCPQPGHLFQKEPSQLQRKWAQNHLLLWKTWVYYSQDILFVVDIGYFLIEMSFNSFQSEVESLPGLEVAVCFMASSCLLKSREHDRLHANVILALGNVLEIIFIKN